MSDNPTDLRRDVALFRYGVIADWLALPPGSPERRQAMREKARRGGTIPGSQRTRVAFETMRDWIEAYERNGFDGLVPKPRGDFGRARRLPPDVTELLALAGRKCGYDEGWETGTACGSSTRISRSRHTAA